MAIKGQKGARWAWMACEIVEELDCECLPLDETGYLSGLESPVFPIEVRMLDSRLDECCARKARKVVFRYRTDT